MSRINTSHRPHLTTAVLLAALCSNPAAFADAMPMMMDHAANMAMPSPTPATLRDPHAYAEGSDFGPIPRPVLADEQAFSMLLFDRLELAHDNGNTLAVWDMSAWYGGDVNRLVIQSEGERDAGRIQDSSNDFLFSHAIAPYWDGQLGLRRDQGVDPSRSWLAIGVQGLAPYWFEVNAHAYWGKTGRLAAKLQADYELLFSQRLILQTRAESNLFSKKDDRRNLGSGLSDMAFGLRLRYELRREFAPYLGVEWRRLIGGTANRARAAGESSRSSTLVAGVRWWY